MGEFTNLLLCLDGREAYDAIMKEGAHFDVLVTDVEMPRFKVKVSHEKALYC